MELLHKLELTHTHEVLYKLGLIHAHETAA
jgi:hypothetical protein